MCRLTDAKEKSGGIKSGRQKKRFDARVGHAHMGNDRHLSQIHTGFLCLSGLFAGHARRPVHAGVCAREAQKTLGKAAAIEGAASRPDGRGDGDKLDTAFTGDEKKSTPLGVFTENPGS